MVELADLGGRCRAKADNGHGPVSEREGDAGKEAEGDCDEEVKDRNVGRHTV